jgi:hypothetical protein
LSQSKILEFSTGTNLQIGFVSALSLNLFLSPLELVIRNLYVAFQNSLAVSLTDYLIMDIYNIGRENNKQILIARICTYQDDILAESIDSFKAMIFDVFQNDFGFKEVMKVVAYYHRTTTPLQNLNLGFTYAAIEVESK